MTDLGRILLITGLLIAAAGAVIWLAARMGFHGLPGDISYRGANVRVYFPIVTCIVLSIVLTLISWIWRWWQGR